MALKTPPAGNSLQTVGIGRRLQQVVVWLLLIGLIVEIGLEASSRFSFQKSLTALLQKMQAERQAGRKLSSDEAVKLISGWPSTSERDVTGQKQTEFRWRSFVWDLRIQLRSDANGAVAVVTIGSGGVPVLKSSEPLPTQKPVDSPVQVVSPVQAVERKIRGLSADAPAALALDENGDGFSPKSTERGRLVREIVRQALLITARDEFNLPTRDAVLGDILPDEENATLPQIVAVTSIDAERRVQIDIQRKYRDGTATSVTMHEFQVSQGPLIDVLASRVEVLSASDFVTTLKKAGFSGSGHAYFPTGTVEEQIINSLNDFEILSQFAAVQALHSEIRKSGESPERLAELVRGYSHLSALSQFLWGPAYKVFGARGLLYAERLMRKTKGSPSALWQRAYVRALVGLHTSALDDLNAAAAAAQGAAAPDWVDAVDAFCHGDLARLSKVVERETGAQLPQFLMLLATAPSEIPTVRLKSAALMLRSQPDCELAFDVALDNAALGIQRQMSIQAVTRFSAMLRDYLRSNDEVPEEVRKLADESVGNLQSEMETRARIVAALRQASSVGRDVGEPSHAVVAQVIQEISFVQACRLLYLEKFSLSVDTTRTLAALRPILKGHRYEGFAEVHVWDHPTAYKSLVALYGSLNREQLELAASPMLEVMKMYWASSNDGDALIMPFGAAIVLHSDRTFSDLSRALRIRASDPVKQKVAAALREISPGSVLGVAAAIKYDWERAEPSAAAWEKEYVDDVGVQGSLAERYTALKRFEDAARCRKRQLELLPEQTVYRALADLYKEHGDEQLWFDTLTSSLEAPSFGLEHARVHSDLAYYHMRRKKWDAARPHADQAAQSYSAWGLRCAAELYERLGDWDQSDLLRQQEAERYTEHGVALQWYFWCQGTGHGNVAAARRLAQTKIDKMKSSQHADEQDQVGLYYVLEDQPSMALEAFREAAKIDVNNAYHCVHAALLADELGQTELRDKLFDDAHARGTRQNDYLVEIVSAFQNCLDSRSDHLDLSAIEWAIRDRADTTGNPTNDFYFVGKFLALRGREAESRDYLQRSATSPEFGKYNSKMAAHALLEGGIALDERRDFEFDQPVSQQLEVLKNANELRNAGDWDKALAAYESLISENLDFANVRFNRALGFRDREEFGPAIADLTRAHELSPGCAQFLVTRGQVLEYDGQYAAAINDYEQAIRIDRRRAAAHYSLAFLRAACPEQEFRDGQQAREHAQIVQTLPEVAQFLKLALLAAAEAESGEFDKAIELQSEALQAAPPDGKTLATERLQMYQRKEPYHRKPAWWRKR